MSVPDNTTPTTSGEASAPAQAPATDIYSIHAAMRPNKLALICGERTLTYAELNARANRVASAGELIAFCAERLADYKKPRSVDFVDELPRNPAGKLLKNKIREPYWAGTGRRI